MKLKEFAQRLKTSSLQQDLVAALQHELMGLREEYEGRVADEYTRGQIAALKHLLKELK